MSSGTTAARRRSRSSSRRAGAAPTDVASAVRDADVVITMVPDSPGRRGRHRRRRRRVRQRPRGRALHRHEHDPPGRRRAGGRGGPRGGRAGARRAGQRRRGGRGRGQPVDHGRRLRPRTSRTPGRCSTRSARPSSTSGPAGSGQTVKAANQLIVAGNIQLLAEAVVFLDAYGVDTALGAGGARRRARGQHRAGPQGRRHARRRVQARLPPRAAPQGHGHRDLRRPRGGRHHPARRGRRPARRGHGGPRRRRAGPLRPAEARPRSCRAAAEPPTGAAGSPAAGSAARKPAPARRTGDDEGSKPWLG